MSRLAVSGIALIAGSAMAQTCPLPAFNSLLAITILIAACSAIGVGQAQIFNSRAADAQIAVTAVRATALQLLLAGKISADDLFALAAQI